MAFAAGWIAATLFALCAVRAVSGGAAVVASAVTIALFLSAGLAYARFTEKPSAVSENPGDELHGRSETNGSETIPLPPTLDQRCQAYASKYALTPRQGEVLRLLVEGMQVTDIAEELYLSKDTVKTHTKAIYAKADVHSRQELVAAVYALGE